MLGFKKQKLTWKQRGLKELKYFGIGVVISLVALFFMTNNLYISKITFSNGEREIIFHGMVHFADVEFYNNVNGTVDKYRDKGYKHYYEGVTGLTDEKFKEVTGVSNVLNESDTGLAKQQDHFKTHKGDENADVDVSEVEKIVNAPDKILYSDVVQQQARARAMIFGVKLSVLTNNSLMYYWDRDLYNAVIVYRDKNLVNHVLESKGDAIITFGEAHKFGVEKLLKDNGYKVVNEERVLAIGYQ